MIRSLFISILFCLVPIILLAGEFQIGESEAIAFEHSGNIFYIDKSGEETQLTSTGRDRDPAIHPNGKWIYFIRTFEGQFVGEKYYPVTNKAISPVVLCEELWCINTDGSNARMLYKSQIDDAISTLDSDYMVATINNIQFSPSGDKVYFEASRWVTSAALHVMKPDGTDEKLLGPGNDTKIVLSTDRSDQDYSGYIVTNQHRYWLFGGSYDWYWLYDPDWNEIGPLGPDFEYFTNMSNIKYTDNRKSVENKDK